MPNSTPKKPPETLAEFAESQNISKEWLEQFLENLKEADIEIKDLHEKLSNPMKMRLLAFLRGKKVVSPKKQTHISKLKSNSLNKSITITRVSRQSSQEKVEEDTTAKEELVESTKIQSETNEKASNDSPTESFEPSNLFTKKTKTSSFKKKTKPEVVSKPTKTSKRKLDAFEEEGLYEEPQDTKTIPTLVSTAFQENDDPNIGSLKQTFKKPSKPIARVIWIPENLTVTDLARKTSTKEIEIIERLRRLEVPIEHPSQSIDQEIATLLIEEMGHYPRLLLHNVEELTLRENIEKLMGEPKKRPPIITIMGHVDHGKTSLLDYIRREKVALGEKGGITQHIGAYHVELPKGVITFLDTPGHAAFTAMRARGARLTDIVALVVAADDGVMPQTREAIEHAQAARVPIVVVVNKMDKPGVSMDLAQQGLSKYNLIPEDWGGETLFVAASAKTGEGVDNLLDTLLLQAEISELTAPYTGPAQGIIIESRLDKGRGIVATMIVQKGTLKKGDILLAGTSYGKIRGLMNESGKPITSATPSIPVEILGLSNLPPAGEEAIIVPNERKAREIMEIRSFEARTLQQRSQINASSESFIDPFKAQLQKLIHVIIKADVQGSAEALKESLVKLSTDEIKIKPLMTGVGNITESDVNLAIASKAIIFSFNTGADNVAKQLIQKEKVTVYQHAIIYELLNEAKKTVMGLVEPETKETILGKAKIIQTFKGKKSTIAGCIVTEGSIRINYNLRVIRNQKIIHEGKVDSLKRFKDDIKEANTNTECGISCKSYVDFIAGDIIESYERTSAAKTK